MFFSCIFVVASYCHLSFTPSNFFNIFLFSPDFYHSTYLPSFLLFLSKRYMAFHSLTHQHLRHPWFHYLFLSILFWVMGYVGYFHHSYLFSFSCLFILLLHSKSFEYPRYLNFDIFNILQKKIAFSKISISLQTLILRELTSHLEHKNHFSLDFENQIQTLTFSFMLVQNKTSLK